MYIETRNTQEKLVPL